MYDIDDICKKYYNTVFKYLVNLTQNVNLSEELTQETFCIAIKEINKFKGNCTISTWLCIIAKHLYYKEIKRISKFDSSKIDERDLQEISFDEKFILNEERVDMYKKLQNINEVTRNVMYLRLLGFSFKEIANITGKSESWSKVVYHRGKKELGKFLKGGTANE